MTFSLIFALAPLLIVAAIAALRRSRSRNVRTLADLRAALARQRALLLNERPIRRWDLRQWQRDHAQIAALNLAIEQIDAQIAVRGSGALADREGMDHGNRYRWG